MPGLVPGIHAFIVGWKPRTWMAGSAPAMTQSNAVSGSFIMGTFKAIRIDKAEKGTTVALTQFDEAELMDGDVTVAVEWSTVNYKDGLAVTGKAPVVRRFPMIAGIDFAGIVEQSSHPKWKAGDKVVSTAGAWAKPIWAAMPKRRASRAIGWCGCPTHLRAKRWRSAPPATPRCCRCWRWRSAYAGRAAIVVTGAAGGVGRSRSPCWRSLAIT